MLSILDGKVDITVVNVLIIGKNSKEKDQLINKFLSITWPKFEMFEFYTIFH